MEDQKRVYLTYRAIFNGINAQIRKAKTITKVVSQHRKSTPCQNLLKGLGEKQVVGSLKDLLGRKIFASELKAKLEFPDLYEASEAQDAQHNASEADAAKTEAEVLENIASLDDGKEDDQVAEIDAKTSTIPPIANDVNGLRVPSLYPLYIPYKTQYQLLTKTQRLLEECCYDFTVQFMPDLLEQRQWDCSEAIELNKWAQAVVKQIPKLPPHCFGDLSTYTSMPLPLVLMSVEKLRHAAVHRLHTTAKGISGMIRSAIRFARALGNTICQQQLDDLRVELENSIHTLELNKNFLETNLEKELQDIARQRKELDKRELDAMVSMQREDKDYGGLIGTLLSQAAEHIFDRHPDDGLNTTQGEQNLEVETEDEREHAPAIEVRVLKVNADSSDNTETTRATDTELERSSSVRPQEVFCHETEDTGWESDDAGPNIHGASPKGEELLGNHIEQGIYTSLCQAIDEKFSTYDFGKRKSKKLSRNRLQKIRQFVGKRTEIDVETHGINLDDIIRSRFFMFQAQKRQPAEGAPKKKKKKSMNSNAQSERAFRDEQEDISPDPTSFPPQLELNGAPIESDQPRGDLTARSLLEEPMSSQIHEEITTPKPEPGSIASDAPDGKIKSWGPGQWSSSQLRSR